MITIDRNIPKQMVPNLLDHVDFMNIRFSGMN